MRFLFGFIFILIFYFNSFGQTVTIPMSSAEKYNKRGFYKNEDAVLKGNEVISDYDGSLMLNYSTHIDLPGYLGGDFTITYNPNIEHRVFWDGDGTSAGYMINSPEWILGYKGFAVQTLNFETNFYLDHQDPLDKGAFYTGEEAPLLVPGYHYVVTDLML